MILAGIYKIPTHRILDDVTIIKHDVIVCISRPSVIELLARMHWYEIFFEWRCIHIRMQVPWPHSTHLSPRKSSWLFQWIFKRRHEIRVSSALWQLFLFYSTGANPSRAGSRLTLERLKITATGKQEVRWLTHFLRASSIYKLSVYFTPVSFHSPEIYARSHTWKSVCNSSTL